MHSTTRGTRRAGRIALLLGVLLFSAAETGGAIAPPCARSAPAILTGPSPAKPVGDPDTPDEGGHNSVTVASAAVTNPTGTFSSVATAPTVTPHGPVSFNLFAWIRSIARFLHLD